MCRKDCFWPKAACRETSVCRRSVPLIRAAFVAKDQCVRQTLSDYWAVGNGTLDHFRHRPRCSAVIFELSVLFSESCGRPNQLEPKRTAEIRERMLAAGLPI